MTDQPLSSQLNATHNPQQLDNQTPSYQVASQNVNRPKRWRWFGYNVLAFMFAFAVFYGFVICILMVAVYEPFNLDWIDKPRLNPTLSIGVPGLLIGLSAIAGSIKQRNGLNKLVSLWPWMLKTGLITTLLSWASVAIFVFMLEPLFLINKNAGLISMLHFIASFAIIAFATALAQLAEVKKIAHRPTDWVKITVSTWTGIAISLVGLISIISLAR
ncbi:hypothetical protein [Herpetosiphon geysericola]|uniref:Uncharacterized protein n=1 Tax=Herpetosiphon geysericola TaxID=70996 RepID=A0A0P6YB16_9CHLR|nr:hypothetical protein [Herpetosiphon geysericola]KPL88903.1 hypothetical protein SE18_09560 [Herpetosiphon geysericola]